MFSFLKKHIPILTLGFSHSLFSGYGQSFFLSIFVDQFLQAFSLSRGEFGALYGWATLLAALLQPTISPLMDKKPLKFYTLSNALVLAATCLWISFTQNYYMLFVGIFLLRFTAQGQMSLIASTIVTRAFSANRGKALSWINLGYPASEMLLPLLIQLLEGQWGWRGAFLLMAGLLLIILIPFTQWILHKHPELNTPQHRSESTINSAPSWSRKQVLKSPLFYQILPNAILPPFLITAYFIHQGALKDFSLWDTKHFAQALFTFAICRGLAALCVGNWVDKWSAQRLFPLYTLPIGSGLLLCLLSPSSLSLIVLFAMCGLTAGMGGNIKSSLLAECFGVENTGSIKSVFSFFLLASTAASPALAGWLLEDGVSFTLLFQISFGLLVAAALLATTITRKKALI